MRAQEFIVEASVPMDPNRRGFLKRAAGTAAAGATVAIAGPQITALVTNFSKEVGGMSGIQALKAMLKVATAAEIDDMYSAASSSVMSDGITDSDMTALEQSGWANRPDVKSWLVDNADNPDDPYWDDFQQWYYDHYSDEVGIYDAFKEVTGKPLKVELVSNIIPDDDLCGFFDEYPEALEIINLQSASVPNLQKLENIDAAAKEARLPAPVVTAANAVAGLVRQIFKSNGKPLTALQQVKTAPALPAPTEPEIELPTNLKQKQAVPVKRQGNSPEELNEFDPGESGFGPFKVYYEQDYLIGQFPTYEEAKGEVDFLRNSDPKSATHHWQIVDGTGKTVWEYDIGDEIDYHRHSKKFQRRP